jgi:hypothetical protein
MCIAHVDINPETGLRKINCKKSQTGRTILLVPEVIHVQTDCQSWMLQIVMKFASCVRYQWVQM